MKYVISFLITTSVFGSPIRIFHEKSPRFALKLKQTLTEQYSIPEDLMVIHQISECGGLNERGKLDLCLKNNGDLLLVSIDHEFVTESLRIFRTP